MRATSEAPPILEVRGLNAGYANNRIIDDVSFSVAKGEIVLFVGHNGAGKSTILKGIIGLLPWCEGDIFVDGKATGRPDVRRNVRAGLNIVLQHQGYFPNFSVSDNLKLGGFLVESPALVRERMDRVLELFPQLQSRRNSAARLLSGGEQRMLSIGIALMSEPRVLLVDEPSAGLAPLMVTKVLDQLARLRVEWGTTILLVEQNVMAGLSIADRALVVRLGTIAESHDAGQLRAGEDILQLL